MAEMTLSEKLQEIVEKLDGVTGRLVVMAMRDAVVKEAMETVVSVSIALGDIAYECEEREQNG